MPLVQHYDQYDFKVCVWEITESEDFFENRISFRSNAKNASRVKQQMASRLLLELMHPYFPFQDVDRLDSGKLVLSGSTVDFSISHTSAYAAAIMSNQMMVGVDIEKIDERVINVDRKFLNKKDLDRLSVFDFDERVKFTTLYWCVKEALFKWWSAGGVDFADHIQIHEQELFDQGTLIVDFHKPSLMSLKLHYQLIGDHWLVYLAADRPI